MVSCDVRSATCGGLVMYADRGGGPYILPVVTLFLQLLGCDTVINGRTLYAPAHGNKIHPV